MRRLRAAAAAPAKGDEERDGTAEPTPPPRSPSTALPTEAEASVNPREGSVNLSVISSLPSDREGTAAIAAGAETADSEAIGEEGPAGTAAGAAKSQSRKRKGSAPAEGDDEVKAEDEEEEGFELVGVPDSELTPEQKKLKRRQQLLKAGREARARARARREQEEKDKVGPKGFAPCIAA